MQPLKINIDDVPTFTEPVVIIPVSDLHLGSIAHDSEVWNRVKKVIKETPKCYWFGMGDYGEFIPVKDLRFDGNTISKELKNRVGEILTANINLVIEEFKEIKDKCLFLLSGNHDDKYRKHIGIDILKIIADRIGLNQNYFPYESIASIFFGARSRYSLKMYVSHGWGGGLHKGAKLNRVANVAKNFDADIIIAGHSHDMLAAPDIVLRANSTGTIINEHIRWLIRVSGFRKSRSCVSSYEEYAGYPPNVTGTVAINIYRKDSKTNRLRTTINFIV